MIQPLGDYDNTPAGIPEPSQDDGFWEDEDEDDETRFVNFSLLSHIAMQLRDKVPRGTHVKGSIPYPRAFTGKDIVVRFFFLLDTGLKLSLFQVNHSDADPARTCHKPRHIYE
jgi:hypothetical protein